MTEKQEKLLYLLNFIEKLSIKYNFDYSLSCGSMLGAIREKGFIKWDDDADIILTRKNYNILIDVLKTIDLPKEIKICDPSLNKKFIDFNIRLFYIENNINIDTNDKEYYSELWKHPMLDIFVLDYIPKEKIKNRLFILKHQIIFGLAMSRRPEIKYDKYSFVQKLAIFFLSKIGKLYNLTSIIKMFNNLMEKYKNKDTGLYYAGSWIPSYPGYQYEKKLFDTYKKINFENTTLSIAKNYDKILVIDYGKDYMTPKKTHTHDNFVENL